MPLRNMRSKTRNAGLFLCLIFPGTYITVAVAATFKTEHTEVRLLSEQQRIQTGASFWLALQLKPEPGWHTYWKNPGDAGKATAIAWSLPQGWKAGALRWPYPKRIRTGSLVSFGYADTVNLLTEISAGPLPPGTDKIEISAAADWLVCEEICIPENAILNLSLSVGPQPEKDPAAALLFKATRALLPRNVPWTARYLYKDNQLVFDAPLKPGAGLETLLFFPVEDNLIENASDQSFLLGENSVRVSVGMGYLQQSGPFHGVLVLKRPGEAAEAVEFSADPVEQLPNPDFVTKSGNR